MTTKKQKIIYWASTIWLALGMVSTGIIQLLKEKTGTGAVDSIIHLGYPIYFLTIIGVWKILGAIAVLIPRQPLLKEWAYAGFFFTMTGALISHLVVSDPPAELFPSILLLVLVAISWYSRPVDRKFSFNQ